MILSVSGKEHLWELKQALYDDCYKNQTKGTALVCFRLLDHKNLAFSMALDADIIEPLFKMIPYFYKTSKEGQKRAAVIK